MCMCWVIANTPLYLYQVTDCFAPWLCPLTHLVAVSKCSCCSPCSSTLDTVRLLSIKNIFNIPTNQQDNKPPNRKIGPRVEQAERDTHFTGMYPMTSMAIHLAFSRTSLFYIPMVAIKLSTSFHSQKSPGWDTKWSHCVCVTEKPLHKGVISYDQECA